MYFYFTLNVVVIFVLTIFFFISACRQTGSGFHAGRAAVRAADEEDEVGKEMEVSLQARHFVPRSHFFPAVPNGR